LILIGFAAGYQVSVVVQYTAPDTSKPGIRSKPALKLIKNTKLAIVDINTMDRCAFIKSILQVHDYGNDYSPGVNRGPPFKISWTGSRCVLKFSAILLSLIIGVSCSGGKGGAPTIETDAEFDVVVDSLKKKTSPTVVVEMNLDEMDGYRVTKKRVSHFLHYLFYTLITQSLSLLHSAESSPFTSPPSSPSPMPQKALPQDGDENIELLYGTKVYILPRNYIT
jgi:hypothetical protein